MSIIIVFKKNPAYGRQSIFRPMRIEISKNGKILANIVDGHALCVVNGIEGKSKGLITRQLSTINGVEKSIIDFVIVSNELIKHIESIHIDVLTKNHKTNAGLIISKSDHNLIETKLNLSWSSKEAK